MSSCSVGFQEDTRFENTCRLENPHKTKQKFQKKKKPSCPYCSTESPRLCFPTMLLKGSKRSLISLISCYGFQPWTPVDVLKAAALIWTSFTQPLAAQACRRLFPSVAGKFWWWGWLKFWPQRASCCSDLGTPV